MQLSNDDDEPLLAPTYQDIRRKEENINNNIYVLIKHIIPNQ